MKQNSTTQQLTEMLDAMRADPLSVSRESVDALWGPARAAWADYIKALDSYEADLQTRQQALDRQGEGLDKQASELQESLVALQRTSRNLASRGLIDEAERMVAKAEETEKQIKTIRRKRAIVESTKLRGDSGLYSKILDQQANFASIKSECERAVMDALALVGKWVKHFEALARELRVVPYFTPGDLATSKRQAAIDRAFHSE